MSKQARSRTAYFHRKWWFRICRALTILIFLGAALIIGLVAGVFASVARSLPKGEALSNIRPSTPTRVLASDGTLLARVYLPDQNREIVPYNRMGYMINATVAIEDERFRDHPGVDPRGILRAFVKNVQAGSSKEGASTITQQLARNLFLDREKKVSRKLREMLLALELERRYSKNEILETYLNQVYSGTNQYGLQSWGAQMAAQNYFAKNVENLTLAEAALLAGLPKNPDGYNPYKFPERTKVRRNLVLRIMLDNALISHADYLKAKEEPIKVQPEKKPAVMADYHAPYFVRHVLAEEMKKIFGQDANDLIYGYGVDIYTSLDPRIQKAAEVTLTAQVQKNKFRKIDDGALISIDPKTGFIKAMVGGTDFRKDQYNIVTQGHRQPGSSFKPFVYTTALMNGYTPKSTVQDTARSYPTGYGKQWSPKNSDGGYRGAMPLEQALWLSRNCAAASVAYNVGIKKIIQVAYQMGIKHPLEPHLSTSLGASVVVPLEICSAYGTLANHGVHHPTAGIMRVVTQDGVVLYDHRPQPRRAIPARVADDMKEIMRGAVERGTGRPARSPFPVSGKTGTTNSYRDAWFIGFTEDLVTAVWVGNRNNQPMNRTFGGTIPAPIWREVMMVAQPIMAAEHRQQQQTLALINAVPDTTKAAADAARAVEEQTRTLPDIPEGTDTPPAMTETPQLGKEYAVMICADTGDRATQFCPDKVMVTYIEGSGEAPPPIYCAKHTGPDAVPDADGSTGRGSNRGGILISTCGETAKIATDKCPTVLLRRFKNNAPTETCPLHGGN